MSDCGLCFVMMVVVGEGVGCDVDDVYYLWMG